MYSEKVSATILQTQVILRVFSVFLCLAKVIEVLFNKNNAHTVHVAKEKLIFITI